VQKFLIIIIILLLTYVILTSIFHKEEEDYKKSALKASVGKERGDVESISYDQDRVSTSEYKLVNIFSLVKEVRQGFNFHFEFDRDFGKYDRYYLPGRYSTKIMVYDGKVTISPYTEIGPAYEEGEILAAGQEQTRTIEIE